MNTTDAELIRSDIHAFLSRYENKELLRFVAVGSVDDGKSTLIGRLLHDTGMVYEDQLAAVRQASQIEGEEIDFSLLTDGLVAEREQGITIDVAYRYFSTDRRKFIIADTPGHVQYTRNMVTGASTADLGIILIDARHGVQQQSRRHAYLASLLGIPHLAVCVNKMDLIDFDASAFEAIRAEFQAFAEGLTFRSVTFFPISALKGDNVARRSENTPWYDGPHVLEFLETVPLSHLYDVEHFRFPVQGVLRPNLDYRGFTGQIAGGSIERGAQVVSLPSGRTTTIESIDVAGVPVPSASVPQSVTLRLADEIDSSRGDMIVRADDLPQASRTFKAHLVWMAETELDTQKSYLLRHTTQTLRAQVDEVYWTRDMDTLEEIEGGGLGLNDVGLVHITCTRAIFADPYTENRTTGSFILIDSLTNNTVAAGMIEPSEGPRDLDALLRETRAGSAIQPKTQISPRERHDRMGQHGATIWLTGLPGSGRWALAYALERRLFDLGRTATVVDPTGHDLESIVAACKACSDAGLITIGAFPSYHRRERKRLRQVIGNERIVAVYVNTSIERCRERRPDANFDDFEPPEHMDITVSLDDMRLSRAVDRIVALLEDRGQFERPGR